MKQREPRHATRMAIRLFHDDKAHRAGTLNLSTGGACLSGLEQLPVGTQVTLRCLHLCIRAQVAWSGPQGTGLRFAVPLTPSDLRALREAVGDRSAELDLSLFEAPKTAEPPERLEPASLAVPPIPPASSAEAPPEQEAPGWWDRLTAGGRRGRSAEHDRPPSDR